jgi:DNA-binding transcriptional ArsR family regulator
MPTKESPEIMLALHRIEDRLQEIAEILKIGYKDALEAEQKKVLKGSALRKRIYDLCDGTNSVRGIASLVNKSIQQVSNSIAILEDVGLVREERRGKEKYYVQKR